MNNLKTALISTAFHVIELLVSLGASLLVLHFLKLDDAQIVTVTTFIVNALLKFGRANEQSPLADWVNNVNK